MDTPEFDPPLQNCQLCGSADIGAYDHDYNGILIEKCAQCGVKFMNPQYTDGHLARFYSNYHENLVAKGLQEERLRAEKRIEYYSLYFDLIEQYGPKGKFLGVGSGDGLELETAQGKGWDVEGYDVDPDDTKKVSEKLGIVVHCGEFTELEFEKESYDCVYMHHVIEHPKDPGAYIEKVYSLLKPGGIYFLSTPNIGSTASVYKTLLGKAGLKKRRGKHYDTWHHLFYYTPDVMKTILEKHHGFDVKYWRSGAEYRPKRSKLTQKIILNYNILPFKSTFMMIAQKPV